MRPVSALLALSLLPAAAHAQFTIASADGKSKLRVGGYLQPQVHAFAGSGNTTPANSTLRRARITLDGTLGNLLDLRVMPDFGSGQTVLIDGYFDLHLRPGLGLRAGKFKVPYSLERLQAVTDLAFVERSLANNIIPIRDIGLMLHHEGRDGFEWQVSVGNGTPDNTSADTNLDNTMEGAARVFWQPRQVKGLGFGVAATSGTSTESLATEVLRSSGRAAIFRYADGTTASGQRTRVSEQGYYYHGPLGILGEVNATRKRIARGGTERNDTHTAYTIQAGWVLTGEESTFRGVLPKHPYDPTTGRGGAYELVVRWSALRTDPGTFTAGMADPTRSARRADALAVGINAYLTRNLKAQVNVERTDFHAPITFTTGTRRHEDALMTSLHVAF